MNILLLLTNLLIFVLICIIKKTKKDTTLLTNIIISIIIYMMYLPISYFILHSFHIKLISSTLIIFNMFISILLMLLLKKLGIQKYKIERKEIYTSIILLVLTIVFMILLVTVHFNVKFSITDASFHYLSSKYFAQSDSLVATINKVNTQNFGETFQFFFYTNLGTIYKIFPSLSNIGQYKVFVCYNFFIVYIIGCLFYIVINKEKKESNIIKQIISILFILGYPLYICLCGFSYWNTGGLLFLFLIYLFDNYELFDKKIISILISSCLFSIFTSYYLFVPVAFFSTMIFLIKQNKKEKKSIKNIIIDIIKILFTPGMLGFSYFILPDLIKIGGNYFSGVATEGAILTDIIANYILFIPIVFYYLSSSEDNFIKNVYLYNLVYMTILFSLSLCNLVSSYYFTKVLYVNWILTFILFYKGLIYIKNTNKDFTKIYLSFYILLLLVSMVKIDDSIIKKKNEYSNTLVLNRLFSIYDYNIEYIFNRKRMVFNSKDYEFLMLSTNYANSSNEIFTDFTLGQKRWYEALFETFPTLEYEGEVGKYALNYPIEIWEGTSDKYAIITKDKDYYKKFIKKYKVIEESEHFAVISK